MDQECLCGESAHDFGDDCIINEHGGYVGERICLP